MHLRIKTTSAGEVRWAGASSQGPTYYGGPPPESGTWKVDVVRLEDYFEKELSNFSFGESIETFVLGFEIGELEGWGNYFTSMSNYTSYRPKMKLVVSVGQLNWPDVKDLNGREQFLRFAEILLRAISRVSEMNRKPKYFDVTTFATEVQRILAACPVDDMVIEDEVV